MSRNNLRSPFSHTASEGRSDLSSHYGICECGCCLRRLVKEIDASISKLLSPKTCLMPYLHCSNPTPIPVLNSCDSVLMYFKGKEQNVTRNQK